MNIYSNFVNAFPYFNMIRLVIHSNTKTNKVYPCEKNKVIFNVLELAMSIPFGLTSTQSSVAAKSQQKMEHACSFVDIACVHNMYMQIRLTSLLLCRRCSWNKVNLILLAPVELLKWKTASFLRLGSSILFYWRLFELWIIIVTSSWSWLASEQCDEFVRW